MPARFRHEEVAVSVGRELSAVVITRARDDGVGFESPIITQLQGTQGDRRRHTVGINQIRIARGEVGIDAKATLVLGRIVINRMEIRIAQHVFRRDVIAVERLILIAGEKPSLVIKGHSELTALDGGGLLQPTVDPAVARRRIGAVQPVVQAVAQPVGGVLRVAGKAHFAHLGFAVGLEIPIEIFTEPDVGRLLNEHPTLHKRQGPRHHQAILKHRAGFGEAVMILVLQHHDATNGSAFVGALQVAHVSLVFDHPDPPLGVELKEDRHLHVRLMGNEFNAVTGGEREGVLGLCGRQNRRIRNIDTLQQLLSRLPIGPATQGRGRTHPRPTVRHDALRRDRRTELGQHHQSGQQMDRTLAKRYERKTKLRK